MSKTILKNTAAIVLCGGMGTRIRPVLADVPKVLAPLGERTVLDIIISFFKKQGIQNIILAIGYGGDKIKKYCAAHQISDLTFSQESAPLGTGGALKKALALTRSNYVIVVNGDTLCPINYADLLNFHLKKNALLSMVLSLKSRLDTGGVKIDARDVILDYKERAASDSYPFMSSGVYIFRKEALDFMPSKEVFSLEYDFLPRLVSIGRCFGYPIKEAVIDIGTPERYQEAKDRIPNELISNYRPKSDAI